MVVRDVTFEDLEQNQTLREEYRFLFRRDVAELDRWVRESLEGSGAVARPGCSQGWEPPCSRPEHRPRGWCSWCSRRRAAIGSRAAGGAVEVLGVGELSSAHGSCNARRCSGI